MASKNKKGKKSSLFMCFKPVAIDDSIKPRRRKDKTADQVVTYFAVAQKEEGIVLPPAIVSSAFPGAEAGDEEILSRDRKKGRDRWEALKAVLNATSLMKMVISRRKANKDNLSRSNSNLKGEASGEISNSQLKSTHPTDSNEASSSFGCSSAFTSSSSLSSRSSSHTDHISSSSSHEIYSPRSSMPLSNGIGVMKQMKQYGVEDRKKVYHGSNISMCMFLISLLVLIMWGKFFAILYTSIWFYLMPPSRRRPCNEGALCGESEFDSVQNKKIIMEGLLERSHSRVSLASSSTPRS